MALLLKPKKKDSSYFIEISKDDWQKFINYDCERCEVNEYASDDYMRGYIKGVETAIFDLLGRTDRKYCEYVGGVEVVSERLRELFRPSEYDNEIE